MIDTSSDDEELTYQPAKKKVYRERLRWDALSIGEFRERLPHFSLIVPKNVKQIKIPFNSNSSREALADHRARNFTTKKLKFCSKCKRKIVNFSTILGVQSPLLRGWR